MRKLFLIGAGAWLTVLAVASCASQVTQPKACSPGTQQICACSDDAPPGVQVCLPDGSAFSACIGCGAINKSCDGPFDTLSDCGACGVKCAPGHAKGATCKSGRCDYKECTAGWSDCDGNTVNGCESDLQADTENCGVCGNSCKTAGVEHVSGIACLKGKCDYAGCAPLFADCDNDRGNGCETPANTLTDCAGCGNVCGGPNTIAPSCVTGKCAFVSCVSGFADCDGDAKNGCESNLDNDVHNCSACGKSCNVKEEACHKGKCGPKIRPVVLVCANGGADINQYKQKIIPAMAGIEKVQFGCNPDDQTQAVLFTRYGQTNPSFKDYIEKGGIIVTEYNISYQVFSTVFTSVGQGNGMGSCQDNAPTVVQFTPNDQFWQDNKFQMISPGQTGCGFSVQHFPGITPLAGWDNTNVGVAYRDLGSGRLWIADFDWSDFEGVATQYSYSLLGYMVTHGQ